MDIEISVTITAPDGTAHTDRISIFSKGFEAAGDIGLSIEEGKAVLLGIQQKMVAAQCEAFCIKRARCTCCDRKLRGSHLVYRNDTLRTCADGLPGSAAAMHLHNGFDANRCASGASLMHL